MRMSRGALGLFVAMSIALALVVLGGFVGLATNAASEMDTWPGGLDVIRRNPWESLLIGLGGLALLGILTALLSRSGPQPATEEDVVELHERFDSLESARLIDDRLERLPPYPYELLIQADPVDRERIWPLIASFADSAVEPRELARDWAACAPASLNDISVKGRLIVGELLVAYHEGVAGIHHLRIAVECGIPRRAFWLVRIALILRSLNEEACEAAVADAMRFDSNYPLAAALGSFLDENWNNVLEILGKWVPEVQMEQDAAIYFRVVASVSLGRLDEAVAILEPIADATRNPRHLLQLSHALRARSVRGTGDSKFSDGLRAAEYAVQARNLRRVWRGDSAEAVKDAAESAFIAEDHERVWQLTRPEPDGEATASEAQDPRVLPIAALGAALTGRISYAQSMVPAEDGYLRRRIIAEIASTQTEGNSEKVGSWRAVLEVASTDDERLHALRGLASEGEIDQTAADLLRARFAGAVAEIECIAEIQAAVGEEADERLRALEERSPLASVRRAELLRAEDPYAAAEILIHATSRWQEPRLLLAAIGLLLDAGILVKAEEIARQALSQYGPAWAGRTTVLRRLALIQSAQEDWIGVSSSCRSLLEIDPNDDDTRWLLVEAIYRDGDPEGAWNTLNRAQRRPLVSTPQRAAFLLELARRFAAADEVARTALDAIQIFPGDTQVLAAATHAVNMRVDRSDMQAEVQAEFSEAFESFIEQGSSSGSSAALKFSTIEELSAHVEPLLQSRADKYEEALSLVRDQGMPIGFLERSAGKPYSAIFLFRPLGYNRMCYPGVQDREFEITIARSVISGRCLVDASALYTLATLQSQAASIISLVAQPLITDSGLRDLSEADSMMSLPSSGTLEFDHVLKRIVASPVDPEIVSRQQSQIRAMLRTARGLRRIRHVELRDISSIGPGKPPVWYLTLDAAKHEGTALWADDTGLRTYAHTLGIKTFSTHALLMILHERGRLDHECLADVLRALIREHVVDLPYEIGVLMAAAEDEKWEGRSVAVQLGRAITWAERRRGLEIFLAALRNSSEGELPTWCYWALRGLLGSAAGADHPKILKEMLVVVLVATFSEPIRARSFVVELGKVAKGDVDNIVEGAMRELWQRFSEKHPAERAVMNFMRAISGLQDAYRQSGAAIVLR